MAGPIVHRANFPDLLAVGFRKRFFDEYQRYPAEYVRLFNFETSNRAYEESHGLTGLGLVVKKPEGSPISYDAPLPGYTKKYVHATYASGFQITMEMMQDDQSRLMMKMPAALGYSMKVTEEIEGISEIDGGFSNTGYDGVSLFSNSHPTKDPDVGNQDNLGTAADLSETSLEQGIYDISLWEDDRGLKEMHRPSALVIHPFNEFRAQKLLQSSHVPDLATGLAGATQGASGGPNDINPLQGRFHTEIYHYLTDPDAWFIRCEKHSLTWFWRMKPEFDRDNHFETKNARYSIIARFSHGYDNWRGWYGNQGA
jgi:hypothetical protein